MKAFTITAIGALFAATAFSEVAPYAEPRQAVAETVPEGNFGSEKSPGTSYWYLYPTVLSHYNVWTGAIDYDTDYGLVHKNGRTADRTTLITWTVPEWTRGLQCEYAFYMPSSGVLTGSKKFDVFTSLAPPTGDTSGWPPGNRRNDHVGRMDAVKPGWAIWEFGGKSFPCPAGEVIGSEMVGVYDQVKISWNKYHGGPFIRVRPSGEDHIH